MPTTSATNLFGGQAYVAIGDITTASGMVDLGLLPRAEIQMALHRQIKHNEIGQQPSDGAHGGVKGASATLTMMSGAASILAALFPEVTDNTTSVTYSEVFAAISAPTMAIMPIEGYGRGYTYPGLWYIPAVVAMQPSAWIYKVEETVESTEPYTVEFMALLRTADQAATAIPTGKRILFRGDPANTGWNFLPSGY